MTATDFAKSIIEGTGGLNSFEDREVATWDHSDRVQSAVWTLRCLSNPACEGSQEAIDAILERRARLAAETAA